MDLIHVILIKNGQVSEVEIKPSHEEIERVMDSRFWVVRRLFSGNGGDILFHREGNFPGRADFVFRGTGYYDCGILAGYGPYGDLIAPRLTLDKVRHLVLFP